MKELDFKPHKSKKEFRKNYKLHDLAEQAGKNLLIQWGIDFKEFGEDNRYFKVWEKGDDKPDLIISYKGKEAFLDWKGKHSQGWKMNKRAADSYQQWGRKNKIPVIVCFVKFSIQNKLEEIRFANLNIHSFVQAESKEWDKNIVVEIKSELPLFTKPNLLNYGFLLEITTENL
jgi:hypothetical protein